MYIGQERNFFQKNPRNGYDSKFHHQPKRHPNIDGQL